MYKILNDQSAPHLRASILKLNDYTNINYNLRNLETDLLFQGQRLISSNIVSRIVVQCSGIIFLMRQKQHNRF